AFDTSQLVSDTSLRWIYDGEQYIPTDFLVYLTMGGMGRIGRKARFVDSEPLRETHGGYPYTEPDLYRTMNPPYLCLSPLPFDGKTEDLRRDKERERRVPLSMVESSERQGKKLKANNGVKGEGVRETHVKRGGLSFLVCQGRWVSGKHLRHREKIRDLGREFRDRSRSVAHQQSDVYDMISSQFFTFEAVILLLFSGAVSNPRLVSSTRRKRIDRVSPMPVVNRIRATANTPIISHDLRIYFGRCELHSTKWDKSSPFVTAKLNVGSNAFSNACIICAWYRVIKRVIYMSKSYVWKSNLKTGNDGAVEIELEERMQVAQVALKEVSRDSQEGKLGKYKEKPMGTKRKIRTNGKLQNV
ncbi:hypothetical protein ALC62_04135, partial [Cyphomyrmex costatus]